MTHPADRHVAQLCELITELAGELGAPAPAPDEEGDDVGAALDRLRAVADRVRALKLTGEHASRRIREVSETITAMATFDYSRKVPITDAGDAFDGLAVYLNVLSEEISSTTVSKAYVDNIIESMSDALVVTDPEGVIRTVNQAAASLSMCSKPDMIGRPLSAWFPAVVVGELFAQGGGAHQDMVCVTKEGGEIPISFSASVMWSRRREVQGLVCVARDLTEARRADEERFRLHEAMQRQAILVEELSAPLLPIAPEVLVLPLIGSVGELRARQIIDTLLRGIAASRARVAIIDITGIRTVDSHAVEWLISAVQSARLIGAEVVLTGIRPETAASLVQLDAELRGAVTFGSLQRGVAYALLRVGRGAGRR